MSLSGRLLSIIEEIETSAHGCDTQSIIKKVEEAKKVLRDESPSEQELRRHLANANNQSVN